MRVPLALLADYANVSVGGKRNIMGIFDNITAPAVPATHAQMRLVLRFECEPAERGTTKKIQIKLLDADGNVLLLLEKSLQLPPDMPLKGEIPEIVEITGLQFPGYGDYAFHILINEESKARRSKNA